MWKRFTQPFTPLPDAEANQAQLLASLLFVGLILGVISGIIFTIGSSAADRLESFLGSMMAIGFLMLPYLVSRTRFYPVSALFAVVIFNLLTTIEFRGSESLASLAPLAVPVFLAALVLPFWAAAVVAVTNVILAAWLPQVLFSIPWQNSLTNGIASIWFLIGLSLLVAVQYKRMMNERYQLLVAEDEALQAGRVMLEDRVRERTAELQAANASLQKEVEERSTIEKRLQERDKQLRDLAQKVVLAQEQERQRMSRELHDDAGQALTALRFNLALIQDEVRRSAIEGEQSPTWSQMLAEAVKRVDQLMSRIRTLAHGLRPAALDDLGLHPALEGLCVDFSTQTGLTIHYDGHPSPPLTDAAEISLYRFLQEALTNAVRHAEAQHIQVHLTHDDEFVHVSVTDDGKGFEPGFLAFQPYVGQSGIGLLGIRERLEAQGGKLELFSQPGQGTHLTARVPRLDEPVSRPLVAEVEATEATGLIRVVIAEDHHVVRAAVADWLNREDDIRVVGEVDDGADLLAVVEETQPNVLLLDVHMPNQRATEAVIAIRARFPHVRILIFSAYDRPEYVVNLVTAGVMGYVLKDDSPRMVLQAIRRVAAGSTWLTPRVAHVVQEGNGTWESSLLATITPREMEVLQLMVDGESNEAIADTLVLSIQTVRNHASSIYRKLGVSSRVEAVLAAMRLGMEPSPPAGAEPP